VHTTILQKRKGEKKRLSTTQQQYPSVLGLWFRASYFNIQKYIQQDATVLSWLLFQELHMFRAFPMPIIRSTLLHRQLLV
jgi:hypothetical protein